MIRVKTPNVSGHVIQMGIEMDNPKMNLNFQDMRSLMILVGQNGVGKTFMLICTWYLSNLVQNAIISKKLGHNIDPILSAQYMWDHCFDSPGTMTGKLLAEFEYGPNITVEVNAGKVTVCDIYIPNNITEPQNVIFMSKGMRTFDAMDMYLKLRANVNGSTEQIFMEMFKYYKLYDIMYVEALINRMPIVVDSLLEARIHNFDDTIHIDQFCVDTKACYFYTIDKSGIMKKLCTYGAGHQSLFNMLIAPS